MKTIVFNPFRFLGHRLRDIFLDSSSWAEFTVGFAVLMFSMWLILIIPVAEVNSLAAMTGLPSVCYPVISALMASAQLSALVSSRSRLRAGMGFLMLLWFFLLIGMIDDRYPGSPYIPLIFGLGCVPNLFIVARNGRDW